MTSRAAQPPLLAVGRAAAVLIGMTLGVKVLGFAEKQVIAYYFGAGSAVDAYFVALSVPMALFLFVRELVEPAFLPLYVSHLDANRRRRAGGLFVIVGLGILVCVLPLVWLGESQADALAGWLAPGFDEATRTLTARLVRLMIFGGAFLGVSALTYITLNGQRRFALPAAGDVALKGAPILCVVLLAGQLGILSLAAGLVIGCVGRLLVHVTGLGRDRTWLSLPTAESREDVRTLSLLMAPLILGVAFSQVSELADNYFSSRVEDGAVAARIYARKIVDLPILLVPYALSVVVFPYFSSLANSRDWSSLFELLERTLRVLLLAFAFLGVATAFLAGSIVSLLLERGAFDARATALTAWPLQLYAAGLATFAIEAILVPFYFALRDTRTPVLLGIGGVCVDIALAAVLISPMGIGGVALALTVSKSLKVIFLGALLKRKRPSLTLGPAAGSVLRVTGAAAVSGLVMSGTDSALGAPGAGASITARIAYLVSVSAAGGIAYLAAFAATDSPERRLLAEGWELVRRGLSGRIRGAGS